MSLVIVFLTWTAQEGRVEDGVETGIVSIVGSVFVIMELIILHLEGCIAIGIGAISSTAKKPSLLKEAWKRALGKKNTAVSGRISFYKVKRGKWRSKLAIGTDWCTKDFRIVMTGS